MLEYLPWRKMAKEPTAASTVLTHNEAVGKPTTTAATTATPESPKPVLSHHDEEFLKKTLEDADDQPVVILEGSGTTTPGISPSIAAPALESPAAVTASDDAEVKGKNRKKEKKEKAAEWKEGIRNRWEGLRRSASSAVDKRRGKGKAEEGDAKGKGKEREREREKVEVKEEEEEEEEERLEIKEEEKNEEDELRRALDGLNLAAQGGRAFSISPATAQLLDRFTQILKDLVNGVPTAYNDLVELLESSSKTLEETFNSLPNFLQKMIKTFPKKMQTNLTPEFLRTVTAAAPIAAEAEKLSSIPSLQEIVTKPGLLMGMLKGVINLLKTRFPMALGGANLAISIGLFVVLFVLWYCHKRGREERLEKERLAAEALTEGEGAATGTVPTMAVQGRGSSDSGPRHLGS